MKQEDPSISAIGEFGLIERLAARFGHGSAVHGIGDDAAVIDIPGPDYLLATVDIQVAGVHFAAARFDPYLVGRRAMAANVSDIAAMGGTPAHALVSLALPPETSAVTVEETYRGLLDELSPYGAAIVGGNVSRTDGPLALDVTLLGLVPKSEVVLRSGARPGDVLAVTGTLGARAALLAAAPHASTHEHRKEWEVQYYVPQSRVAAARSLAAAHIPHAMIDISDGLAADAGHISRASRVGILLREELLPIDDIGVELTQVLPMSPEHLALTGGEDYELLIALAPESLSQAQSILGDLPLTIVGQVIDGRAGVWLEGLGFEWQELQETGWRHF